MQKHHRLISFCAGLIFLIVLQKFATPEPIFRFLIPAFLAFAAALTLYNYRYLKSIAKYNIWTLIRPLLLLCAGFSLFWLMPSANLRGLFLVTSVIMISLFEILLGSQAENVLLVESLVIAFGMFFGFFGWYHYAPGFQTLYLLGIFASVYLLTRSTYEFIPQSNKTKIIGATTLGFFCAQLFWAANFLPFHFSFLALLLFNFYYFCLVMNYYHLFHVLNFKKLQMHLALMAVCVIAVLISTPWRIIS